MPVRCLVWVEHRGEGPLSGPQIWADDHVVLRRLIGNQDMQFPGCLYVETRRHVPGPHDRTEDEAPAVARAVSRAAR